MEWYNVNNQQAFVSNQWYNMFGGQLLIILLNKCLKSRRNPHLCGGNDEGLKLQLQNTAVVGYVFMGDFIFFHSKFVADWAK